MSAKLRPGTLPAAHGQALAASRGGAGAPVPHGAGPGSQRSPAPGGVRKAATHVRQALDDFAPLLATMAEVLRGQDPAAVAQAAQALHAGVGQVHAQLRGVPAAQGSAELALQRAQLADISAQISAQRLAVVRAQAAAQRRAEVLLPSSGLSGYGAQGTGPRATSTGAVQA